MKIAGLIDGVLATAVAVIAWALAALACGVFIGVASYGYQWVAG